jgi:hypothetical protein
MTLKWYAEGKECEIKIKIDANGVDLVKGDDFSLERLEANRDVKIGGLFLHEIEFREKGQGKSNEVEHDGQDNQALKKSFETFIGSDISRGVGIQATDTTRGIGSQTTIPRPDSENDLGYESQGRVLRTKKPLHQCQLELVRFHLKKMFSMSKGEANLEAENQIEVSKCLIISKKVQLLILQMVLLSPSL